MRPTKLSTNFVPYTDADFGSKTAIIIESMINNPHFPAPVPTLESIRVLLDEYSKALTEAMGKATVAIAEKNGLRKKLGHELTRLALYVMYIADGDEAILISSGFTLAKKPAAIKIDNPGSVTIKNGITAGQLLGSVKAVSGAKTYQFEITSGETVTDSSEWQSHNSSRRSFIFSGLTPGRQYHVRVAAIGSGKQKTVSSVASMWAQ